MPNAAHVQRALDEGAQRSRDASARSATERAYLDSLTAPATARLPAPPAEGPRYRFSLATEGREILTPEVLWRRFKWPIIALGLFALLELLSLGKLITVMGTHF